MGKSNIPQHEPLRVPQGWEGQNRAFVIQLERILNDIYKHFRKLRIEDFSDELIAQLKERLEEE